MHHPRWFKYTQDMLISCLTFLSFFRYILINRDDVFLICLMICQRLKWPFVVIWRRKPSFFVFSHVKSFSIEIASIHIIHYHNKGSSKCEPVKGAFPLNIGFHEFAGFPRICWKWLIYEDCYRNGSHYNRSWVHVYQC